MRHRRRKINVVQPWRKMQRGGGRPSGRKDNPLNPRKLRQETEAERRRTNNSISEGMKKSHANRKQAEVNRQKTPGAKRPVSEFFLPRSSKQKQFELSAAALLEESGASKQTAIELSTFDESPDTAEGGGETINLTAATAGKTDNAKASKSSKADDEEEADGRKDKFVETSSGRTLTARTLTSGSRATPTGETTALTSDSSCASGTRTSRTSRSSGTSSGTSQAARGRGDQRSAHTRRLARRKMQGGGGRPSGRRDNPFNPRKKRQETEAERQRTNNNISEGMKKKPCS